MPGCSFLVDHQDPNEANAAEARRLQSQGELLDYDLEELTAFAVFVIWRKPDS
jgi:hypothetical protein